MRSLLALIIICAAMASGCARPLVDASRATRVFPMERHASTAVDIQVFRHETEIELVNATGTSYANFDLWLNQRYVRTITALPAGSTVRLSLWGFYDMRGEVFNAGGFWRTEASTPIWIAEIETAEDAPLIGLVTIGSAETRGDA